MFELNSIVLFVHVLAGVALVGHSLGSPVVRAMLREAGDLADLRRVVAVETRAGKWNPLVALVLLLSGIYLGRTGWWSQGWFYVSLAAWLCNALLAALVVHSTLNALASASAADGPVPSDVDALRRSTRLAIGAQVMLANDVALLFIMFNKPTLLESIALCGVACVAFALPALVPRRAVPELSRVGS